MLNNSGSKNVIFNFRFPISLFFFHHFDPQWNNCLNSKKRMGSAQCLFNGSSLNHCNFRTVSSTFTMSSKFKPVIFRKLIFCKRATQKSATEKNVVGNTKGNFKRFQIFHSSSKEMVVVAKPQCVSLHLCCTMGFSKNKM